jgi:iron complex outermembrane receptor protein
MAAETALGQIALSVNATYLSDYKEFSANPDGSIVTNDLAGIHTDETFQRAFPDLRVVTRIDWARERWSGTWAFRWTDEMKLEDRVTTLDSVVFSDLQLTYNPPIADDGVTLTMGFNNVFDEDPPLCFPCGVIGLSTVSHDQPGRVGYVRFRYELPE